MNKRNSRRAIPIGGAPAKPSLKQTPFPGLIDDNVWEVREGRWPSFIKRSDLEGEGGVMQVPLEGTDEARKLRLHEQAHVTWPPNISDKEIRELDVQERTIQACEDGRMIKLTNVSNEEWKRINQETNILSDTLVQRHEREFRRLAAKLMGQEDPAAAHKTMSLLEAAHLIASSRGYYEAATFDRIASTVGMDWLPVLVNDMHHRWIANKKHPTFDDTIDYARELERFFEELEKALLKQQREIEDADMPQRQMPEIVQTEARWGEMVTEQAPLTEKLKGDPSRRVRATDIGAVPRYMHRLLTDQRVFGRRRKHKAFQGTVLIDLSGSMSLEPSQVEEILSRWPAVTIATYSGSSATGTLRIVAKNGRRAATEWLGPPDSHNNMVDGPALDWLNRQKGPRIWISDGGVTGIGGTTQALILDAARKVNRGKVKRIPNVQELLGF